MRRKQTYQVPPVTTLVEARSQLRTARRQVNVLLSELRFFMEYERSDPQWAERYERTKAMLAGF